MIKPIVDFFHQAYVLFLLALIPDATIPFVHDNFNTDLFFFLVGTLGNLWDKHEFLQKGCVYLCKVPGVG